MQNRVYFLTGQDEYGKGLAIKKIKSDLAGAAGVLDCHTYYGKDAIASDIIDILNTVAFQGNLRFIILKQAELLSEENKKILAAYLKNPSKNSIFIIRAGNIVQSKDTLAKAARKYARHMEFPVPDKHNINSWIKKEFAVRKKSVEPQAIMLLNESCAGDLEQCMQYIEQVCLYTGRRKNVTREDVAALISEPIQLSTFGLIDDISANKKEQALRQLFHLLQLGKSPYEIIGLIAWHFRRMGMVKIMLKEGAVNRQIASRLGVGYNIAQKIIEQTNNFSLKKIRNAQEALLDTDLRLKTTMQSPEAMLQILLVQLGI